jgi:hypothetical protein
MNTVRTIATDRRPTNMLEVNDLVLISVASLPRPGSKHFMLGDLLRGGHNSGV